MTFTVKDWQDSPSTSTPLSQAALENLESRLAAYTDLVSARKFPIVDWRAVSIPQSTAAATLFLPAGSNTALAAATTLSPLSVVYIDPADIAVTGATTQLEVDAICLTNATAPAITFTVGLYPISAVAGGADVITMTAGTVQAGSTVAFASPTASTRSRTLSGVFTAPAAGYYALGVVLSGTTAASSREVIAARVTAKNLA